MDELQAREFPKADAKAADDTMQLLALSNFNGVCRMIAALAENGCLAPHQLDNIHDCMTTPLDDPDWRDDGFVTTVRDTLEVVLARALSTARDQWSYRPDN